MIHLTCRDHFGTELCKDHHAQQGFIQRESFGGGGGGGGVGGGGGGSSRKWVWLYICFYTTVPNFGEEASPPPPPDETLHSI